MTGAPFGLKLRRGAGASGAGASRRFALELEGE
jgi:hypothetical protein